MCAAFTAQMADFSISIEKSSHLSFLSQKEMVSHQQITRQGFCAASTLPTHAQKTERAWCPPRSFGGRARSSARVSHASPGHGEWCGGKGRSGAKKMVSVDELVLSTYNLLLP